MAHLRAPNTTSNSNLVVSKRDANPSFQPEIYHLFFVRVSAGARRTPEDGNETVADLSQPLADFGQFGASLAIPENTRFGVHGAVPIVDFRLAIVDFHAVAA